MSNFRETFFSDKVMVGALAGVLGASAMDLFGLGLYALGLVENLQCQLAASMYLPPPLYCGILSTIAGVLTSLTIGGTIGVLFIYFVRFTGRRLIVLKGLLSGPFFWVSIFGALRAWRLSSVSITNPGHVLLALLTHLVMGTVMGWAVQRFGSRALDITD